MEQNIKDNNNDQEEKVRTEKYITQPEEIDSSIDVKLDDKEHTAYVRELVKTKTQRPASKVVSEEQMNELFSKLQQNTPVKGKSRREKLPLEERKQNRSKVSWSIIEESLSYIFRNAAFIIELEASGSSSGHFSVFQLETGSPFILATGELEPVCMDKPLEPSLPKVPPQIKKDIVTEIQYVTVTEVIRGIFLPRHLFSDKSLFFWSAYIQRYISKLKPVQLLTCGQSSLDSFSL